jgi:putative FmdB family regulatory protein
MPTYDYICSDCGYEFEHFQSMSEEPIRICPNCSGTVRRKIGGGTGLIFKGSGYYLTDYANKSRPHEKEKMSNKSEKSKITKVKND